MVVNLQRTGAHKNREEVKNSIKHSFSSKSEVTTAFSDLKNPQVQSCRASGGLGRVVEGKEGRVTGGVTAWRASRYGAGRELFVATSDYISEVTPLPHHAIFPNNLRPNCKGRSGRGQRGGLKKK